MSLVSELVDFDWRSLCPKFRDELSTSGSFCLVSPCICSSFVIVSILFWYSWVFLKTSSVCLESVHRESVLKLSERWLSRTMWLNAESSSWCVLLDLFFLNAGGEFWIWLGFDVCWAGKSHVKILKHKAEVLTTICVKRSENRKPLKLYSCCLCFRQK